MAIEIDGSVLEGGGQILRSAVAFAAVLGKELVITKIRAKRKTAGLRPQHLHGLLAMKKLTNASVKGTHVGSTRVEFAPESRKGGEIVVDIGTAGSVTLILQAVMILAPFCNYSVKAKVIGGTNVAWSPPVDYLQRVLLPRLRQMRYLGAIELEKRGYYPRGGGRVTAVLHTIPQLTSLTLSETREIPKVSGISYCGALPRHVAERQAKAATEKLSEAKIEVGKIQIEHTKDTFSPGSGVCLWTEQDDNRIIGSDGLGRRGLKAEKVGEQVATDILQEFSTNAPVDLHQADMLIPYLALAQGASTIPLSNLTLHTITNIHVVEQFIDVKFEVKGEIGTPATIAVKGIGLAGVVPSPEFSPNE